ncbi:hypothetical protein ACQP1V_03745 [Microtetraspora malaysiensis]|uniref:hypothetical protein n=1 Tax=Microtetraspora malaysiensis TaxID=161358 RepID=UPI003D9219A4
MRRLPGDLDDALSEAETAYLLALTPTVGQMVVQLQDELALLNIPTWLAPTFSPDEGVVSIWYGLVARVGPPLGSPPPDAK